MQSSFKALKLVQYLEVNNVGHFISFHQEKHLCIQLSRFSIMAQTFHGGVHQGLVPGAPS